MLKFVILLAVCALASAQQHAYNKDPKTAAIISEQRYLSGDGQFGAAYTQEDGTDFKEETDADGTRHGSYSYIDPNGQKRTVSYTAGKDGFRATGDHLPVAPAAAPQAAPQPQYQPQQQYQPPQQHYQPQPQQHFASAPVAAARSNDDYDDGQYDPRYNDPSFQGSSGPSHRAAAPQPQYQQTYQPAPQQPQYHQQAAPQQPQYHQQAAPQQQYQPQPQQHFQQAQPQYETTPAPHRFQPPGKLSLNRTPDGYSYSFNKV